MKTRIWAAILLCVFCAGCLRTYRMEQSSTFNSVVSTDGTVSVNANSNREERHWQGPYLPKPVNP